MFLTTRLGRYLLWRTGQSFGITLLVVLFSIFLVDVVEQMRTVGGDTNAGLFTAASLTAMRAPSLIQEALAFIVLIGSILCFVQLNRSSELSALRAGGVSAWRFASPTIATAVLLGLTTTFIIDPVSVSLNREYEATKAALAKGAGGVRQPAPGQPAEYVWLRQGDERGQEIVKGRAAAKGVSALDDVTIYFFTRDSEGETVFERRIDARHAELRDGFWQLYGATENRAGAVTDRAAQLAVPTGLAPDTLLTRIQSPETMSIYDLPRVIENTRRAGFSAARYEHRRQRLLARAVLFAAMAAFAAAFCLRLARLGGLAAAAGAAIASGVALIFVDSLSGAFAAAELAPAPIAAWSPPVAALCLALALIAYREDG